MTKVKQKTEQINFFFHHIIRGEKFKISYAAQIDLNAELPDELKFAIFDISPLHSNCNIIYLLQDGTAVINELKAIIVNRIDEDIAKRKKMYNHAKAQPGIEFYEIFPNIQQDFENEEKYEASVKRVNDHFEHEMNQKFA
jgi:hypothetical protein